MVIETASVLTHESLADPDFTSGQALAGDYRLLTLKSPSIASSVKPGQFVHLRVPGLDDSVLRRPFSVFKADGGNLAILYQCVGKGTRAMSSLNPGDELSLLGPLGNGFPAIRSNVFPILVAGGYGIAALYLLAERSSEKGIVFVGGAGARDILCTDDFEQLGWEVRVATEHGSAGEKGLVTGILDAWLTKEIEGRVPEFFACGPNGMLKAVAERAITGGWNAWLSMDRHMGCGMGACLACVQKVNAHPHGTKRQQTHESDTWKWARICIDGPVFECRDIIWEDKDNNE